MIGQPSSRHDALIIPIGLPFIGPLEVDHGKLLGLRQTIVCLNHGPRFLSTFSALAGVHLAIELGKSSKILLVLLVLEIITFYEHVSDDLPFLALRRNKQLLEVPEGPFQVDISSLMLMKSIQLIEVVIILLSQLKYQTYHVPAGEFLDFNHFFLQLDKLRFR